MSPQEFTSRFGSVADARTMQQVQQFARDLHGEDLPAATALLQAQDGSNPLTGWLRASLFEAAGNHREAAVLLETLPDRAWGDERTIRLLALARNLSKIDETPAWMPLRDAIRAAASYRQLTAADQLLSRLRKKAPWQPKRTCRLAIAGTATFDFWLPALRAICFSAGIDLTVFTGGFDQYQQEILDPNSALAEFRPEIVLIAADWRSLALPDESPDPAALVQEKLDNFRRLWRECRERLGAFVIQHNFEVPPGDPYGRLTAALPGGRARQLHDLNGALWNAAREEPGVAILDLEQTAANFGKQAWSDPVLWHAAKQYPAPAAIPALAREQTALLRAVLGLSSKCLVLDLDGVLWGGVIGEDGLAGIALGGTPQGEAFVAFQRYVRSIQRRGIPLCICSKNNEDDAREPFRQHPEMVLELDDITLFLANWDTKDENLRRIASTLNIGIDSLVFVDDNPFERSMIRRALPEIEVPEMPADPSLYIQALDRERYFEALSLTQEDRQRTASYRDNAERQVLAAASTDVDGFLRDLQMHVELKPFDAPNLPRIVQLINKTNQFNLTTRRMSAAEVDALLNRPNCYTQFMRLRDRFGDSGLTGVLIAHEETDTLRIDNWLLSCRVLGRRIEELMLAAAHAHAVKIGLKYLSGEYVPTPKNGQVRDLYGRFGFELIDEDSAGTRKYRLPVREGAFPEPDYCRVTWN
ncbi:MAG: HAD-IIIC family phosphatase [Acidobacteriota bacterium]|nr:HAD-IIIC family phosphatase [Acidobacteriota bacterium]